MEGETEYAFWHALIRDVAYAQIPRAQRAAKHRGAAEWIEAMAGDRVSDHAELLVHHYSAGLELSEAVGKRDDEVVDRARRSLLLAAERAMRLDVARARSHLAKALELTPIEHPERGAILLHQATAAHLAGDLAAAKRAFEDTVAAFQVTGDRYGEAQAKVERVPTLWMTGDTTGARELLEEAVPVLEHGPRGRALLTAYDRMCFTNMLPGRMEETLVWTERAVALATDLGIDDHIPRLLQYRGIARCGLGDVGGLDDLKRARDECVERGLGYDAVVAHNDLGDWMWLSEGPAAGLEVYRQGIALGERRGILLPATWGKAQSCWTLFDLGRWDELQRVGQEVLDWDAEHGPSQMGIFAATWRTYAQSCQGLLTRDRTFEREVLPRAREAGDTQALVPALGVSAFAARRRGDLRTAAEMFEEILRMSLPRRGEYFRVLFLPQGVRTCIAASRRDLADAMFEGIDTVWLRHRLAVATGRAILAESDGDLDAALAGYFEVAEGWRGYGYVLEHGQALLGAGQCLLALGRSNEAEVTLRIAADTFASHSARPYVEEADGLLTRASALGS